MLYYVILYYIMLYYVILYYIMLYYVILYYIMLYYIILYYIMLYYVILYYNRKRHKCSHFLTCYVRHYIAFQFCQFDKLSVN